MPYYMQGDYYRAGDPGFFSFIGKGLKAGLGLLGIGGGGGGVSKTTSAALSNVATAATALLKRYPYNPQDAAVAAPQLLLKSSPPATLMGSRPGLGLGAPGTVAAISRGARKCKHVNPRTGKCIRRMRVTNVKALRRAIRRSEGFAHLAKRVLRFTSPHPPRGRAVFKTRKRARRV